MDNKALVKETKAAVKVLDENILLLDYKNNYDIDGILEKGVSNVGELISHIAKVCSHKESDFTVGSGKGSACSAFDTFTRDGDHITGRNFDFKSAPCLVVWTHPKNHYESLAVVDNNFMLYGTKRGRFGGKRKAQLLLSPYFCVDGINEKGLSIVVLQIKAKATKQTDPSKLNITTTAMIRGVLDTCADVYEAVDLIKKYNMHDSLFCCYHYLISDKNGKSVIVEYIDNKLHIYEKNSEKYDIKNSVYENDGLPAHYITNYCITKDIGSFKVEQHGEDRAEAIIKTLKEKENVLTELEAMDLLQYVKLDYDHPKYPWRVTALWSAVYNAQKSTMKIAAGMDYTKIYTFSVKEPCKVLETEKIEKSAYPHGEWAF